MYVLTCIHTYMRINLYSSFIIIIIHSVLSLFCVLCANVIKIMRIRMWYVWSVFILWYVLNENVTYRRGRALPKNGGPRNNGETHRLCTGYVYAIHWTCILKDMHIHW